MAPRAAGRTEEQQAIGKNPEEHDPLNKVDDNAGEYEEGPEDLKARIAQADAHMRAGLEDPSASVRAQFEAALLKRKSARAEAEEGWKGPWIVKHRFRYHDKDGQPAEMTHLMPTPDGQVVPRILQEGDIPDAVAQEMWAQDVIDMAPRKRPKPRPVPRTIASPVALR